MPPPIHLQLQYLFRTENFRNNQGFSSCRARSIYKNKLPMCVDSHLFTKVKPKLIKWKKNNTIKMNIQDNVLQKNLLSPADGSVHPIVPGILGWSQSVTTSLDQKDLKPCVRLDPSGE